MAKSLAYICVEHPDVKEKVDKMGDVVRSGELDELRDLMLIVELGYCPAIHCDEGSQMDRELRANKGMHEGHHYSVVKEIDFSREG